MGDEYDVVCFKISDRKICTIAGERMSRNVGFHNAEKRLATLLERSNEHYSGEIVPAGKYKVGDMLT